MPVKDHEAGKETSAYPAIILPLMMWLYLPPGACPGPAR